MSYSKADELLDKTRLQFGKHRGKTPREVAAIDPEYVVWMHANVNPTPCSRDLALTCEDAVNDAADQDRDTDIAEDW